MSDAFYIKDYHSILLRITENKNINSNQVINLLPRDRESIFPQTEIAAAGIRADPIQFHNFRAWAFTMLDLLGFVCTDPVHGYYRLATEHVPEFLSANCADPAEHSSSFELLQRTLQSMALVGLGHHAKQIYNHMLSLFFLRKIQQKHGPTFQVFMTWCNLTLLPLFCSDIQQPFPNPEDLPSYADATPMLEIEYLTVRGGTTLLKLLSCKHGVVAIYNNDSKLMRCRMPGEKSCGFAIAPELREKTS